MPRHRSLASGARACVVVGAAFTVLRWSAGWPIANWRALTTSSGVGDAGFDHLLINSAALAAWVGLAWFCLVAALALASRAPGVIGRLCRDVPKERAADVIFGYSCANDVTARDLQARDGQWTRAKGFDTFCPLGPWMETGTDPADLGITTTVNGNVTQHARTSELLWDVPSLVEFVSSVMTLLPGDVLLTGTPEGVGPLTDGDEVSVTIESIGTLTNRVVIRD